MVVRTTTFTSVGRCATIVAVHKCPTGIVDPIFVPKHIVGGIGEESFVRLTMKQMMMIVQWIRMQWSK